VNTSHQYDAAGDYLITLDPVDGCELGFGDGTNTNSVFGGMRVYRNMLTRAFLGTGVTSIGDYAFYNCSGLSSVVIPDSVTSIGDYAFYNCSGLSSVVIPDSVTSIGGYAFYSCTGMGAYHLKPTTPPTLSSTNAFTNIPSDCIIYVPKGCLEAYQTATNWSTYADYMQEE
jgi:hypothetical protein